MADPSLGALTARFKVLVGEEGQREPLAREEMQFLVNLGQHYAGLYGGEAERVARGMWRGNKKPHPFPSGGL